MTMKPPHGGKRKTDWMSIETAPKDGTKILTKLYYLSGSKTSWWTGDTGGWHGWAIIPSHWKPLQEHGGKRANSGRKKGTGKGRTVKSSSITLKPEQWAKLDVIRGKLNRSKWIAARIDDAKVTSSSTGQKGKTNE